VRLFTPDDGLSNSHINQIYQDSKGYIWIATENGLNVFNGYEFEVFLSVPNDSASIQSNFVTYVFEDSRGFFWVATANGLFRYDRTKKAFSPWKMGDLAEAFRERRCNYIFEDRNHNLWVSFPGDGVVRLDAATLSPVVFNRNNSGIEDNTIICIHEDRHGNLWFGTEDHGVYVFNPQNNTTKRFYHIPGNPSSLSNNKVFTIRNNTEGAIWVGTIGGGINVFDEPSQSFLNLKTENNSMENRIYTLLLDNKQAMWVGTDGAGIFKYDAAGRKTKYWEEVSAICDLRNAKVHVLFQDIQGNIWAALHQKGVLIIPASENFFQNIGFNPFNAANSIGTHCVISIIEDHKGNIWAGTDGEGLYRIQPNGIINHYTSENTPGFLENVITALFEDKDHHIWIGTYVNGFFRFDPQTEKFDSHHCKTDSDNSLSYDHVTVFKQDEAGNLWIGTNGGGISVFNPKTQLFKKYLFYSDKTKDQLSSNWVFDILIDRDKDVWAATSNGLNLLYKAKDKFETCTLAGEGRTISNLLYTILEDYNGNIWVGSYFGLHCIDKSAKKPYLITAINGLPDNMITGIEEDREHVLWISTGKGLCKYNPESNEFMNFFAEDGIQSNEFRRGSHFKGKNDKMYFGGIKGITTFRPPLFLYENPLLALVFTELLVFNEPVKISQSDILKQSLDETSSIRLKYNQRSFTFRFAALEYSMPQRVSYFAQMENFDNEWHRINNPDRSVTYTNLNAGTYVLKVKATIDGNNILQNEMQIIILRPWWRSTFAYAIYIFLLILLLISIYVYISNQIKLRRERMEKEQQKQISESKLQFFTDISHEIRTPLTLIIGPLETLIENEKDASLRASLRIMYQNAIRILRMINQLMDLRALDKGKLKLKIEPVYILDFIRNIMDSFTDLAATRQISYYLKTDCEPSLLAIDKDCLDKIIFNLLSNAFKFTPKGGSITVEVYTTSLLVISVLDTGIGITKEKQQYIFDRFFQIQDSKQQAKIGTGIGLHLAKMMAELHHGSLEVESEVNKGSKFTLKIPLDETAYKADERSLGNEESPVIMLQPSVTKFEVENITKTTKTKKKEQDAVLVVEDDADILHYIESELIADYQVYTATNGKEGLTKAMLHLPDVIVSDIVMPEMDGLTLCKLIKTNEKTCHIPVILLTAKTSIAQRIEGLETGADSYIPKPFNMRHLQTRIEQLIRLRETLKQKFTGELEVVAEDMKVVTSDEKLLYRLNEKLKKHIANPDMSVESISKELGISRVQLNRRLKLITNDSPGNYIRNYRLKHAAWLLVNKNMTIAEVAYAVGFSTQAYFSSIFKEHYGMTPTEFAETNKGSM